MFDLVIYSCAGANNKAPILPGAFSVARLAAIYRTIMLSSLMCPAEQD